ncbi:Ppx/GppA phosphatase family protein [Paeniglutamicibacter cryotolerans]|uniref:Exopolyphosphatase/guanosine-5'-triphosphate, 3'-diphosphate pyrophosphatase n=1 Tax=Paeniglutamicibacter cryotolerans TaxID=670079 RepID=A0A839QJB0_9MICC|nr:Ppx/GppA phosphatase family protein [Paeniglutamicibacter cryotolerans]MBB2995897.1 exopolyphosphatase/guanosine-5'-triphosphate,3'-diphosphate pyrophosphatase [Paeniglutamicibacter cryotolerans]
MPRIAAIDCGTNSIRLLIADAHHEDAGVVLVDVVREMRIVRLGQGVDATGAFAEEALNRTFAAVDEYAGMIAGHGATAVRFVATSATRDASNRQVFIDGVRERLGIEPEVVPGTEEAALSFAGAVSVAPPGPGETVLVVDLGGGSTELVLGDADGVLASISLDMGCVRHTERFLRSDPPTASEISEAEAEITARLEEAFAVVPVEQAVRIIGVAGTITTLTAHGLGLEAYDSAAIHGAELPLETIAGSAAELLAANRSERSAYGFMHPGRVDVIGAGALIWKGLLEQVAARSGGRITSALTSEHDILDGIALGLVESLPSP